MPDLNKMTLDEILDYCQNLERENLNWLMDLFVKNEGFENAVRILAENKRM